MNSYDDPQLRTHRPFAVAWIRKNAPADSNSAKRSTKEDYNLQVKLAEFYGCQEACFLLDIQRKRGHPYERDRIRASLRQADKASRPDRDDLASSRE
jgi:hypothetical protein